MQRVIHLVGVYAHNCSFLFRWKRIFSNKIKNSGFTGAKYNNTKDGKTQK